MYPIAFFTKRSLSSTVCSGTASLAYLTSAILREAALKTHWTFPAQKLDFASVASGAAAVPKLGSQDLPGGSTAPVGQATVSREPLSVGTGGNQLLVDERKAPGYQRPQSRLQQASPKFETQTESGWKGFFWLTGNWQYKFRSKVKILKGG